MSHRRRTDRVFACGLDDGKGPLRTNSTRRSKAQSARRPYRLSEYKKEIFIEIEGEGFDVKVLKEIIRLRKQDKNERDEHQSLLDLYLGAMEVNDSKQAKAA